MASRLFSRDSLSWGQILFLWVGGLVVATPILLVAYGLAGHAADLYQQSDNIQARAAAHAVGRLGRWESYPGLKRPLLLPGEAPDTAADRLAASRLADSLQRIAPSEHQEAASLAVVARHDGVTALLLAVFAVAVVAFLVWRSFHGAARPTPEKMSS